MGKTRFETRLDKHPRLALDTMVFVYAVENQDGYRDIVRLLLKRIESGLHTAYGSMLLLTELLVSPYRLHQSHVASEYKSLLRDFPNFKLFPVDAEVADLAASMRSRFSLNTPDALHIANALQQGATAFITNDKALVKVKDLDVILLNDYLPPKHPEA